VQANTTLDLDVVHTLARARRAEAVQLYALAALRQCKAAVDWAGVVDAVTETLLAYQQPGVALATLRRVRGAYAPDPVFMDRPAPAAPEVRTDVDEHERAWLVEVLYTLELVVRLVSGDTLVEVLDARMPTLNLERVAHTARAYRQHEVALKLYRAAGQADAVAAVLLNDIGDLSAAFLWAARVDDPAVWRMVGLAQAAAYRRALPSAPPAAAQAPAPASARARATART
jgi:hypothetical protein